jgi:iron complex transport system substrate-binding protein
VVAPFGYWEGIYSSGCCVGVECTVFRDLGLTIYEGALSNDGNGLEFSPEELGQLDGVDYVFTSTGTGAAGLEAHEEMLAAAEAGSPLWSTLTFVENDHVIPFEMEMVYGSPSGQLAFLEVVANALGE